MNSLQPVRFFVILLAFVLAAMVAGTFFFLFGMGKATYLVTDGVRVGMHYLDKPRYDMHLQGLIFALSFLIAGGLLLLMILLPDRDSAPLAGEEGPPQPRIRPGQPAERPQPAPASQPAPPAAQPAHQTSPLSIESEMADILPGEAPVPAAVAAPPPEPPRPAVSVEEEVLRSATGDDLPSVDLIESRFDDTGEEDVVYGNGRVTEDAAWDFVQQYPDSSVKFLYRKTLDNKALSPTEEDIYRNWEMRGLSRGKVRQIVLDIMGWQSLPDIYPHEIWRELRDQIYEIKAR